jgi:hypothetical protein
MMSMWSAHQLPSICICCRDCVDAQESDEGKLDGSKYTYLNKNKYTEEELAHLLRSTCFDVFSCRFPIY